MSHTMVPIYRLKLVKEGRVKLPLDKVDNSNIATQILHRYLSDRAQELVAIIMVDAANNYLGVTTISVGGISHTGLLPRDIFTPVIAGRASAFILGHNHPSGDVTPSMQDVELTKNIYNASKIMGIGFLDHIIVSSGISKAHYSFLDRTNILKG